MPERARHMYGYMRSGDWLGGYASPAGVEKALMAWPGVQSLNQPR